MHLPVKKNLIPSSTFNPITFSGIQEGLYRLIRTKPEWNYLINLLKKRTFLACDLETSGLSYQTADIVGFAFSFGAQNSFYIPVNHTKLVQIGEGTKRKDIQWREERSDEKQLHIEDLLEDLKNLFANPNLTTIWHNYKFDGHFLIKHDIKLNGPIHDTLLISYLLNENESNKLKDLATRLIDLKAGMWENQVEEFRAKFARKHKIPKAKVHYGYLPLNLVTPYACADAHYTFAIFVKLLNELREDPNLMAVYTQIENPLLPILLDMEERGVAIDRAYFKKIQPQLEKDLEKSKDQFLEKLGNKVLNINSNKQIIPALAEKGIRFSKKTEKGAISLDHEVLEKLSVKYSLCHDLLEYRNLTKLKVTYVDSILTKSEIDGCIHCQYNQNVRTGRMCISEKCLVNIPYYHPSLWGKRFDTLSSGDHAYSINAKQNLTVDRILNIYPAGKKQIYIIKFEFPDSEERSEIRVTADHKIRMKHGIDVECRDLQNGDILLAIRRSKLVEAWIISVEKGEFEDCFDIEMENFPYFFANGICVHNSGKEPNLMNVPAKDEIIREGFICPIEYSCSSCKSQFISLVNDMKCPQCEHELKIIDDQYVMLLIDFSQVELRLLAHFSEDPIMLQVYREGIEDIHTRTMCEIFEMDYAEAIEILKNEDHSDYKEITQQRKIAKIVNFLISYQGGAKALASNINTLEKQYSEKQCQRFIDKYFLKYKGIKRFINKYRAQLRQDHYIKNYFNRTRRFPILKTASQYSYAGSKYQWEIEQSLRAGVNHLIQSTAADLFKSSIIRVNKLFKGTKSRVVIPIHDEIISYLHRSNIHLIPQIKATMEDWDFKVPIVADVSYSTTNWANKRKIKAN